MATALHRRVERLEAEYGGRDGCLACALAKLTNPAAICDGQGCNAGLVKLLTGIGGDDARSIEAA